MKKITLFIILTLFAFRVSSQCTDCHDGRNLHHSPVAHKTPNGSKTLGISFDTTLCGLNFVQAIQNTQTRFSPTLGCGFPAPDTVTGLPNGCINVLKAYLYCEVSCETSSPSNYIIKATVTNPAKVKNNFTPILIGSDGPKCWSDQSTGTWRADITSAIAGNGVYTVDYNGFTDEGYEVDGISIIIIYQENTVTYTGTFILSDGQYTKEGGSELYTDTGFKACGNSTYATAFADFADIQNNAEANFSLTENGTTATFPSLFFQSTPVNTNVIAGQDTSTVSITLGGDCYAMFIYGLYFQSKCLTCTPVSLSYTSKVTPAACGSDSGSAQVTVSGNDTGVTYLWNNGVTLDSIHNVLPGTYTCTITGREGCPVDKVILKIPKTDSAYAVIKSTRDSVCPGDSLTLSGIGGTKYLWTPGNSASPTLHINPLVTTTYTLHTFTSQCKDSAKIKINVIPKITDTLTVINDTVCPLSPTILTATVKGGQALYRWSNGATTSTITVHDTATTTYTATAYGICDSVRKTIKVVIVPLPKPVIGGKPWACKGTKANLVVSSSTNPTKYVWYNGSTNTSINTGVINADSIVYVTAYNRLGCSVTVYDTVQLRAPPIPIINFERDIFCAGQPITLMATATGTGAPFTYTWSTGQTGSSITINPGPDSTTTYTVIVSNGCTKTATATLTPTNPHLNACCSQTLLIDNDTTILVAGGNSKNYKWTENPAKGTITCLDPSCDSVRVITPVTTSYTVVGTDSNGCQAEQVLLVNIDIPCLDVKFPNVFTPDNAGPLGLNNVFYIRTENIDAWSLTIYDRWGKEMYNSTNPVQYWSGTTESGAKASDGVYYYVLTATCQSTTYKKDGFIQLIR